MTGAGVIDGYRVNAGGIMVTKQVHLAAKSRWGILGNKTNTHTHIGKETK